MMIYKKSSSTTQEETMGVLKNSRHISLSIFEWNKRYNTVMTVLYLLFHSNIDNEIWRLFFKTPIVSSWVVELLFLYIIICVSSVDHSVVRLRSRFLSYLGEISYGIYMYQMLVIFATILFLKDTLLAMTFPFNQIVYYLVVFVLIIFVSAVSKVLFEDYFLKLKGKLKWDSHCMFSG